MSGAKYPKFENQICNGFSLKNEKYLSEINLKWLILAYEKEKNKDNFFNSGAKSSLTHCSVALI